MAHTSQDDEGKPPRPATRRQRQAALMAFVADDVRARAWELHLRCVPNVHIAQLVGLDRHTVAKYVAEGYRLAGADLKAERRQALDSAVLRMRRVQEQAWNDHDADDARERGVLERAVPGARYHSQRAHYLRVILDAEVEIARLEGLYEARDLADGEVVFRFERVSEVTKCDQERGGGFSPSTSSPL